MLGEEIGPRLAGLRGESDFFVEEDDAGESGADDVGGDGSGRERGGESELFGGKLDRLVGRAGVAVAF